MPNRLADSSSPYLLQHADNPVDWWEWGPEAFEEARRRDVPVLLSVGYAACHWCHVMAHESFEDPATAGLMNEAFVCVKVDREERPDVDAVYMAATQALTGHGGWPMTCFLDHGGNVFYAGTYWPREPRGGGPTFPQVVQAVSGSWSQRRTEVLAAGSRIAAALAEGSRPGASAGEITAEVLDAAVAQLATQYDGRRGGFGGAPKFPPSMVLEFLLRHHARTGDPTALDMVAGTCEAMARGGMYDQLAGGFARYSVDADWVVPHFEKMLYDNALLLRVYVHWWRATGSSLAKRVARETADFLLRDLRTPQGGFAASLDADTEGVEGLTYAWTPQQLIDVLGPDDGRWAAQAFFVTAAGTFDRGSSVLQMLSDPDDAGRFEQVRRRLHAARAQRPQPACDDKVVAAWNGLAISALAEASVLLDEPRYLDAATAAADLLIGLHLGAGPHSDRLVRVSRTGRAGRHAGVLEDHACVAEGFLTLAQVTGAGAWLTRARVLLDAVLRDFAAPDGSFYDTAADAEELVRRPQELTDGATPSGSSAAAGALLTAAALTSELAYRDAARSALGVATQLIGQHTRFAGWWAGAAEAWLDGPREVAVVGPAADPRTARLLRVAWSGTAPGLVVACGDPDTAPADNSVDPIPLLADRPLLAGAPAAYVCRAFSCQAPTSDPATLAAEIGARTA